MNTDELQRILKLTQQGHGVGMTTKFWAQLEALLSETSVPVSELRKWQDDLKIAVGETSEYSTRIMLEIIIDDIDELIEANTQEVF